MLIIEKLFNTYGFQFATVIGLISYFATRYFNRKDKKEELRHTLFQNLKVESINNFIESYTASELCWFQLPYYDVIGHKLTAKEVDSLVLPTHNKLISSYYKLFVSLDENELEEFTKIYDSNVSIHRLLGVLLWDYDDLKLSEKVSQYQDKTLDEQKNNRKLLKIIGKKFALKYG